MTKLPFVPSALLFDWGDTLMKVLPGMEGPMSEWPEIVVLDHAKLGLESLSKEFPCYIATNAKDSDSAGVWAALIRVGMNQFISGVFTNRETGCEKTSPEFYSTIGKILGIPLQNLAMIGDNYRQDILSAHKAGLKTVWLSSTDIQCQCHPSHDAEVNRLDEITNDLLKKLPPSLETCLQWLNEQQIPENILAHMQRVAMFAYQLASNLNAKGFATDPIIVHRAALLHDIGKLLGWRDEQDHAVIGGEILREKGFPELAKIVEVHNIHKILTPGFSSWDLNAQLVYYADKRFKGTTQVNIKTRIEDMAERYPQKRGSLMVTLEKLINLEHKINNMIA